MIFYQASNIRSQQAHITRTYRIAKKHYFITKSLDSSVLYTLNQRDTCH